MDENRFSEICVMIDDGTSQRKACSSHTERKAFQRMKNRKEVAHKKKLIPRSMQKVIDDVAKENEIDFSDPIAVAEAIKIAGIKAALRCNEGSHYASVWKEVAKALCPDFAEKKSAGGFLPQDYAEYLQATYYPKVESEEKKDESNDKPSNTEVPLLPESESKEN